MEKYRELILELISALEAYDGKMELTANQGQALDGYAALAAFVAIARKAKEMVD